MARPVEIAGIFELLVFSSEVKAEFQGQFNVLFEFVIGGGGVPAVWEITLVKDAA